MHNRTSLSRLCYPWCPEVAGALLLRGELGESDKLFRVQNFGPGFGQFSRGEGGHEMGSARTGGSTQGSSGCWLCLPLQLPSCPCFWPGIMLLPPVLSLRPSAGIRSRPRPHAVPPGRSHQGPAVVGALPPAAGCLRLHGRRLAEMPARL